MRLILLAAAPCLLPQARRPAPAGVSLTWWHSGTLAPKLACFFRLRHGRQLALWHSDPAQKRPKAGVPTADNPRTGAYRKMIEAGRDLHELHALIAPRPFLVSGGAEDPPARWTALNHAVAVNHLLGFSNRVARTSRKGHTPTEESNAQLYAFFERFLK